jgi:hypothetical protein
MKLIISALGAMTIASQIRGVGVQVELPKRAIFSKNPRHHKDMKTDSVKLPPQQKKSDSPELQKLDYRKGDNANTFQEYKDAVRHDYTCVANEKATTMNPLLNSVIMVYGSIYTSEKLPSLRGESGAILLESERPEYCLLSKYNENPDNVCIQIDQGRKSIEKDFLKSIEKCIISGQKITDLIDPKAMERFLSKKDSSQSGWLVMTKISEFVQEKFDATYISSTPGKRKFLERARNAFYDAIHENNEFISSTSKGRQDIMVEKSAEIIKNLNEKSAVTVVVGDLHSHEVANGLSKTFPERAIVLCKPKQVEKFDSNQNQKTDQRRRVTGLRSR